MDITQETFSLHILNTENCSTILNQHIATEQELSHSRATLILNIFIL